MTLPFVGTSADSDTETLAVFGYIFGDDTPDDGKMSYSETYAKTSGSVGYTSQVLQSGGAYPDYYYFAIPKSIRKVTITNQTIIPAYAFRNCDLIKEITFTKAVTEIGKNAFENCSALTTFNYGGTKTQWNDVMLGVDWKKGADALVVKTK